MPAPEINVINLTEGGSHIEENETRIEVLETWSDETTDYLGNQFAGIANVLDYGAVADGTTDCSPAFAAACAAAQIVLVPPTGAAGNGYLLTEPLVPADNQSIIAVGGMQYPGYDGSTRIYGDLSGPLIDGTGVNAVTIRGISFGGDPTDVTSEGIEWSGSNWSIEDCTFNQFGGRAMHMTGGAAARINGNLAMNCIMVRSGHAGFIGVLDLEGHDVMVTQNEVTPSMVSGFTDGYICALRSDGGNGFYSQNVWEFAETGVILGENSYLNTFVNDRSDANLGHGWNVSSVQNRLIGCRSYRNGLGAADWFNGFRIGGTKNLLIACSSDDEGDANKVKYALNDLSGASGATLNHYVLNEWRSYATAATNFSGSSDGYLDLFSNPTVTGSRGGNAALADLLTQLAAIGLITDGTS